MLAQRSFNMWALFLFSRSWWLFCQYTLKNMDILCICFQWTLSDKTIPTVLLGHTSHSKLYYEEFLPIWLLKDLALKFPRNPFVQMRGHTRHHLHSFRHLNKGSVSNALHLVFLPRAKSETLLLAWDKEFYFPNKQVLGSLNPLNSSCKLAVYFLSSSLSCSTL